MKKILLLSLAVSAMLASCSGNDDNGTTNNDDAQLVKMSQKQYDGGILESINVFEYTNGKMTGGKFYSPDNVLEASTQYTYTSGMPASAITHDASGTVLGSTTNTFDSQGRIMHIASSEGSYNYTKDYTYTGNTVTVTSSDDDSSKTFYINSDGLVYKETSGSYTVELNLDGANPLSMTVGGTTTTYEYDTVHDPALMNIVNIYGNYLPNRVLISTYLEDTATSLATKYVVKQTSGSDITQFTYTFNDAGLPVNRKTYYNGTLTSDLDYFYE